MVNKNPKAKHDIVKPAEALPPPRTRSKITGATQQQSIALQQQLGQPPPYFQTQKPVSGKSWFCMLAWIQLTYMCQLNQKCSFICIAGWFTTCRFLQLEWGLLLHLSHFLLHLNILLTHNTQIHQRKTLEAHGKTNHKLNLHRSQAMESNLGKPHPWFWHYG
jgi:hypothetical protein